MVWGGGRKETGPGSSEDAWRLVIPEVLLVLLRPGEH